MSACRFKREWSLVRLGDDTQKQMLSASDSDQTEIGGHGLKRSLSKDCKRLFARRVYR